MRRYTIKELNTMTDEQLLKTIVVDRRSTLTNPYTPLYTRLTRLISKLERSSLLDPKSDTEVKDI